METSLLYKQEDQYLQGFFFSPVAFLFRPIPDALHQHKESAIHRTSQALKISFPPTWTYCLKYVNTSWINPPANIIQTTSQLITLSIHQPFHLVCTHIYVNVQDQIIFIHSYNIIPVLLYPPLVRQSAAPYSYSASSSLTGSPTIKAGEKIPLPGQGGLRSSLT